MILFGFQLEIKCLLGAWWKRFTEQIVYDGLPIRKWEKEVSLVLLIRNSWSLIIGCHR